VGIIVAVGPVRGDHPRTTTGGGAQVPIRTTGGSGPNVVGTSNPNVVATGNPIADARTVVAPETQPSLLGAASDVKPAAARRSAIVAVGVLGVGILVGGYWVMRPGTRQPTQGIAPPPTAAPSTPVATNEPQIAPVASVASPPPSADVEVTIQSSPAQGVDVYLGSEKIGSAPGPVHVKRGDASIKLTLKAAGYASKDVDVMPTANVVVSASLTRAPAGAPTVKRRSDLENPF
jgi:serine/threonine-protein kinase